MRGNTCWQYKPYTNLLDTKTKWLPYICRVAPFVCGFEIQWFDNGQPDGAHKLLYRGYTSMKEWTEIALTCDTCRVEGLVDEHDYEFKVVRADDTGESGVRLARTGFAPATVVNYLHPEDQNYAFMGNSLTSPTIAKLPSGDIIAAMDVYRNGTYTHSKLDLLFKSKDGGKTWRYVTDIFPSFVPKLFTHRGKLYILATSQSLGDLIIGRSDDEGETWTVPARIALGTGSLQGGFVGGPQPVIEHNGRLYTGNEYFDGNSFKVGMISIDAEADLLVAENWTMTPFIAYDPQWPNASIGNSSGCAEGNAIVSPGGVISNYLRYDITNCVPSYGKAVVLRGDNDDPEAPLKFDRIVECPLGSNSKFVVRFDPQTKKYIMIGTEQAPDKPKRTVLSMAVSDDFYTWNVVKRLFDYRDADWMHVAVSYPDWLFDGDDIIMALRVAFGRSIHYHDTNYQCFHRVENFRQYFE